MEERKTPKCVFSYMIDLQFRDLTLPPKDPKSKGEYHVESLYYQELYFIDMKSATGNAAFNLNARGRPSTRCES